jgi:hypothetical protein
MKIMKLISLRMLALSFVVVETGYHIPTPLPLGKTRKQLLNRRKAELNVEN